MLLSHSCERLSKTSIRSKWTFNDSWRRLPDIIWQNKLLAKGDLWKQKNKNTQANECPNRSLLTKIMDNEASRAHIETCQNQEWHISQIDGYFENALK